MTDKSGGAKFTPVHPSLVKECWDEASRYLERACSTSDGRYDARSLRREVDGGFQTLWILYRGENEMIAAATTGFANYPLKKYLTITFLGSNDEGGWYKHRDIIIDAFKDWAKSNNCSGIELVGRKGWIKALSCFGFRQTSMTIEMEI